MRLESRSFSRPEFAFVKLARQAKTSGTNPSFEDQLWVAVDKLRGNMEPFDCKHVVLGLIFLKYISDGFEATQAARLEDKMADAEDPDEYRAGNVFWVPIV